MKKKKRLLVPLIILVLIAAMFIGTFIYLSDYYHANDSAFKVTQLTPDENDQVTIKSPDNYKGDIIVFEPEKSEVGLIFYPGGKVEYSAYSPLMNELAKCGVTCIIPHMPGNLAFFDVDAAAEIRKLYPDITRWYIGGHSLGGVAASTHVSKNLSDYEGLILLASYSTSDLSQSDLNTISIYGSNDQVLGMESYSKNLKNLPSNYHEYVIEGGNHAYFGSYGAQDGDGTADITNEEQIYKTVEIIIDSIRKSG